MQRPLIDRATDTTAFSVLLFVSSLLVLPVLAAGVLFSPVVLAFSVIERGIAGFVFVLLSAGGTLGIVGWLRARWGARTPERHNVALTLAFLAIGIATALAVLALVAWFAAAGPRGSLPLDDPSLLALAAFVVAHGVWIVAGIAGVERLMFSYAVRTGRTFDAIPLAMLLVALGLAVAVLLTLATLR